MSALTLYEAEEHLVALLDTDEIVPEEQREEFESELALAVKNAVDKRESVARFRIMLDQTIDAADAEIKRLQTRKRTAQNALKRLDERVIIPAALMLPRGKDGKPGKLQGHTTTLRLQANPASVDITDEAAVPSRYKTLTITVPAEEWEFHIATVKAERGVERPAILDAITKTEMSIDRRAIKRDLEADPTLSVPGADLAVSGYSVRCS